MPALAIILGRHGSKGLPGKNIAPVAGKPCIAWTIEHAHASGGVGAVVVSCDAGPITDIASSMGTPVLERPSELAGDQATVDAAARHALEAASADHGRADLDPIVLLYANVPVRPPDLTDRAIELQAETGCDSVQSYAEVGKHHPWWTAVVDDAGRVRAFDHGPLNHNVYRRQDLPPAHLPDGGVIVVTRAALTLAIDEVDPGPHAFFGRDRRGIITREREVIDIDTEADRLVADVILDRRRSRDVH
ncbi:MAG: acylneuraminate cytidylyltransferase family protein [Planctomycetota bacterium]